MGAYVFVKPLHRIMWVLSQVQTSSYFFQDAAPYSQRARRINGAALGLYSAFQAWSCFAIWQHVYDCQDHFIDFMSVPVNLKHWLLAAQVNVAIIAIRFAVRALSDERNLMFCPGLMRVRLPEAEVLKLKDIMQASSW